MREFPGDFLLNHEGPHRFPQKLHIGRLCWDKKVNFFEAIKNILCAGLVVTSAVSLLKTL